MLQFPPAVVAATVTSRSGVPLQPASGPFASTTGLTLGTAPRPTPTRVLFFGTGETYLYSLPSQFTLVARHFGEEVETATPDEADMAGCTLYAWGPNGTHADEAARLLAQHWDFIVLQEFSLLPTVALARRTYIGAAAARARAQTVLLMPWGYHDGAAAAGCPEPSYWPFCGPLGSLSELTRPNCSSSTDYHDAVGSYECMGYAEARAALRARADHAVDRVAPTGLAQRIARGGRALPTRCRALVDREYEGPIEAAAGLFNASCAGVAARVGTYERDERGQLTKHPNVAGQYINALTLFATIFRRSPIGAPPPIRSGLSNLSSRPENSAALSAAELSDLQQAAATAVHVCGQACGAGT